MFKLKEKFKTRKRLNLENIYEMLYQSLSLNQEKISKLEIELEEARAKNRDDFWGKNSLEKQLTKEIEKKDAIIQELREYNQKLYDYAYKLATIIQADREKSFEDNQKLLDENKISHYKFMKDSNYDESIIRHWKAGSVPRLDIIYYIAKNLGGSIDELIGRY